MQLSELKLDNTRSYMVDVHGKKYPIKKQRGRFYIQHSKGQLTVTPAMIEKQFDDIDLETVEGWQRLYEENILKHPKAKPN